MLVTAQKEQIEKNHNRSFIVIEQNIIKEAEEGGYIEKVGRSMNGNVYYKVHSRFAYNCVIMHVSNNKYITINSLVNSGLQIINLVNLLEKFSFCAKDKGNGRECVIWNVGKKHKNIKVKQISIERIIRSYIEHGQLRQLPKVMHLHHKAQTWDNRESTTMYIHENEHKHRKRHLSGIYVNSIDNFTGLLNELKKNEEHYRGVTEVK